MVTFRSVHNVVTPSGGTGGGKGEPQPPILNVKLRLYLYLKLIFSNSILFGHSIIDDFKSLKKRKEHL